MPFTDEQLQRLKENFDPSFHPISPAGMEALLARLSAAEEFIRLGSQEQSVSPAELHKAEIAWRKASGKEPKA